MTSREAGPYGPIVADHVANPRGAGALPDADRVGRATNDACGDVLALFLQLDAAGVVVDAGFQATGCPPAIAVGSLLVERLRGRPLAEAADLTAEALEAALGGLPRAKRHVLLLARQALQAALESGETP